jgi:hypothetical protein
MSEPWWWQMKLRPHHLLDIITQYGQGRPFEPSDYGHAVHTVARLVLADQTQQAEMVVGADDICAPCRNLLEGCCTDVVSSLDPPVSKQDYNDDLDRRVLGHLGLEAGQVLTIRAFADRTLDRLQDLEQVCSHPGEEPAARLRDLRQGLQRMGLCLSR